MSSEREADRQETVGAYGDAVEMALKVPTLSGFLVAFAFGTLVWAWQRLRRRPA